MRPDELYPINETLSDMIVESIEEYEWEKFYDSSIESLYEDLEIAIIDYILTYYGGFFDSKVYNSNVEDIEVNTDYATGIISISYCTSLGHHETDIYLEEEDINMKIEDEHLYEFYENLLKGEF